MVREAEAARADHSHARRMGGVDECPALRRIQLGDDEQAVRSGGGRVLDHLGDRFRGTKTTARSTFSASLRPT